MLATKGYLAFPPSSNTVAQPQETDTFITQSHDSAHPERVPTPPHDQAMEEERLKRRERERALGEHSEIEWVRAGGVLRDASGRRDKARTERIRQELRLQGAEKEKVARWEAYEARWRAIQSSTGPITFLDFPWPLAARVSGGDVRSLTRAAVSDFLFESLAVRANATTKKERVRVSLLRWHPDKISFVLSRVVPDDLELVREGVHAVFSILKALQDAEGHGSTRTTFTDAPRARRTITHLENL